ncbi:hypothetical protein BDV93DRAFT_608127 [Ceratobasidium sp. AG-I]|nr:hypothetical protein BDV93DRAFT_608127 [Ceratobasidium sp. AG-I]
MFKFFWEQPICASSAWVLVAIGCVLTAIFARQIGVDFRRRTRWVDTIIEDRIDRVEDIRAPTLATDRQDHLTPIPMTVVSGESPLAKTLHGMFSIGNDPL